MKRLASLPEIATVMILLLLTRRAIITARILRVNEIAFLLAANLSQ